MGPVSWLSRAAQREAERVGVCLAHLGCVPKGKGVLLAARLGAGS